MLIVFKKGKKYITSTKRIVNRHAYIYFPFVLKFNIFLFIIESRENNHHGRICLKLGS